MGPFTVGPETAGTETELTKTELTKTEYPRPPTPHCAGRPEARAAGQPDAWVSLAAGTAGITTSTGVTTVGVEVGCFVVFGRFLVVFAVAPDPELDRELEEFDPETVDDFDRAFARP